MPKIKIKMRPGIKKLWVQALRSGRYKQGKHRLRDGTARNPTYCCLGVLANLHAQRFGKRWRRRDDYQSFVYAGGEGYVLPKDVQKWAGLAQCNPRIAGVALSTWNDQNNSFDTIADLIERGL